jgi:hypothetical protein
LGEGDVTNQRSVKIEERLYVELWVSLASLLRSYTAAHGLNGNRQATVELGEDKILVRHSNQCLDLSRLGSEITWLREDGRSGRLHFTEHGRLDAAGAGLTSTDGEEMDMTAERWARELMTRELPLESPQ